MDQKFDIDEYKRERKGGIILAATVVIATAIILFLLTIFSIFFVIGTHQKPGIQPPVNKQYEIDENIKKA